MGDRMAEFWRSTRLPRLEARRSCQVTPCYRPHSHDAFSIGMIDAGASVLTSPLDGAFHLEVGDVIVIPAGHVHACNPDDGPWRYQMIHMDQGWATSLAPRREVDHLFAGISVLRRPDLHRRLSALNDAIFTDESGERLEARFAAVIAELDTTSPDYLVSGDADAELIARLAPIMDRLRYDESNPTLAELAGSAGMTKYQLVRAMRRVTGLAPLAWRQNARVQQARHMLREGRPIAETAHTLGFSDQSHFHRVFRAHVAATPATYRG